MRVIGLGTGRCGTLSLAKLLGLQKGAFVTHERKPVCSWQGDRDPARHFHDPKTHVYGLYGDIAFYYLPHLGRIWAEHPDIRCVCLKRDVEGTWASFENYLEHGFNPWEARNGEPSKDSWWRCYPHFTGSREEAFRRYWTTYYQEAERLAARDERLRVFPVEDLNTEAGVRGILDFLEVADPVVELIWDLHHRPGR